MTESQIRLSGSRSAIAVILGLLLLVAGARLMVDGASGIARDLGISEAVIGLTVVAVGTSLPELAAALVAAWRRHSDLVLANIVGSNIFNALAILGITSVIAPIPVAARFASFDAPVMLAAATFLLALIYLNAINRLAGVGLLGSYAVYVVAQGTVS